MSETTLLRWFDHFPSCQRCGKASNGILRGQGNASYGYHCNKCAEKRLKDSEKARKQEAS